MEADVGRTIGSLSRRTLIASVTRHRDIPFRDCDQENAGQAELHKAGYFRRAGPVEGIPVVTSYEAFRLYKGIKAIW